MASDEKRFSFVDFWRILVIDAVHRSDFSLAAKEKENHQKLDSTAKEKPDDAS